MADQAVLHAIEEILPPILTVRHHLHAHPEIALGEWETGRYLRAQLAAHGINPLPPFLETDVVALVTGATGGRNVTLRADMDALPLEEQGDLPYRSAVPGMMHACGHDGHCAMLLGAAVVLNRMRHSFRGSVRFVFQPGEEVAAAGRALVAAGVLAEPRPDAVLALHAWPGLPLGAIGSRAGAFMAAADFFRITIKGRGGHGSRPERTVDPILVATRVIERLYALPSRRIGALEPVVITVCSIHGGRSSNVIPDEVVLEGTIRFLSRQVGDLLPGMFEQTVRNECESSGASCDIVYERPYIPTINDGQVVAAARGVVEQRLAGVTWVDVAEPSMGAEDFSWYLDRAPGAMFFLGMGEESPQLHNTCFDFNDHALKNGIRFLVSATLALLER